MINGVRLWHNQAIIDCVTKVVSKLFRIYYAWKLARKSQSGMIIIIIWLTSTTTMTRIEN